MDIACKLNSRTIQLLKDIKSRVSSDTITFIDDHTPYNCEKQSGGLLICVSLDHDGNPLTEIVQNMHHPQIVSYLDPNMSKCTNPLYIKEDRIHLSRMSSGPDLVPDCSYLTSEGEMRTFTEGDIRELIDEILIKKKEVYDLEYQYRVWRMYYIPIKELGDFLTLL